MPLRLETPRLILRPFEERDVVPFAAYRSDPEVARYQGWEMPYSLEKAARFVAEMSQMAQAVPGQWMQLAAERKQDGQMIGDLAFKLSADRQQAEVGLTVARPFQRQGYGLEGMRSLFEYLLVHLALHRVHANIDPRNLPSCRLVERLGMRREGRFVESLWHQGAWADEAWYALLRREWAAGQATVR